MEEEDEQFLLFPESKNESTEKNQAQNGNESENEDMNYKRVCFLKHNEYSASKVLHEPFNLNSLRVCILEKWDPSCHKKENLLVLQHLVPKCGSETPNNLAVLFPNSCKPEERLAKVRIFFFEILRVDTRGHGT